MDTATLAARAEEVLHRARSGVGSPKERHPAPCLELLGLYVEAQAPAALLEARLEELRVALGVEVSEAARQRGELMPLAELGARTAKELRARGFEVELGPSGSGALDWSPSVPGRRLRVRDPRRQVPRYVPYAPAAPAPEQVAAQVTVHLLPLGELSTTVSRVRREQPGQVRGAVPGVLVLSQQPAQSLDQDDGALGRELEEVLFGRREEVVLPELATALGATSAVRKGALLEVVAPSGPPAAAPLPAGVVALLWTVERGASADLMVRPRSD